MGEAAPAQPTASGFPPMLGVGMVGAMPGGVNGPITGSRGSAVPQLHSAIVERLRARIELCRRHHSTCENRYQRGQAENSDREHESTLQLLSLVHQGPGNRKTKGNRSTSQQPPEFNRVNGEQKANNSSETESKLSTRIALQGSLRRKIEGQPPGFSPKNGLPCVGSGSDFKRFRMETNAVRPGPCALGTGQSQTLPGTLAHPLHRKDNFMIPHSVGSDLFNMTLREMKKEPIEVHACGHSAVDAGMMPFDFKDEGVGQIDPELQDLFDELTKSVPSLNDLELEKMLKHDEDFSLDLGRPSSAGAAHPCPHLDKPIKTEYSSDFGQATGGSPQLRPASAGPSFSMTNTTLSQVSQASATPSRGLPAWPELSHAEQLKQMAANQQQPNSLLHHHQQSPSGGVGNWSPAMGSHSSPSPFGQDKPSGSGPQCQQRISPQTASQSKGMTNCLFKPNGYSASGHTDMKVLSSKPMLHFSPKGAPSSLSQEVPLMSGNHSKSGPQQPTAGQSHPSHAAIHFQNPQLPLQGSPCLQPKSLPQRSSLNQHGPGINFKMAPQRQVMPSGPRLPSNGRLVDVPGQPVQQQRAPVPNSQQKTAGKTQGIQRQLGPNQYIISEADKVSVQDQFNRHLARPPPDYKQPRSAAGGPQTNLYTGMNSQPMTSNGSDQTDVQALSCQIPGSQGSKMMPTSGERRFATGPDPHQSCPGQQRQHNNQGRLGLHQNKPQFQGNSSPGIAFTPNAVSNVQHARTSGGQDSLLGPGLSGMTPDANRLDPGMNWTSGAKQVGVLPGLDVKILPNTAPPQVGQTDMAANHFPPRPIGPPNQVAPHSALLPAIRGTAPRPSLPRMPGLPGVSGLNQPSPEQQACTTTFATPNHSPGTFQNNRPGRLTFDFLQDGDNTVPGINTDSDFIDSLLKSGSGSDDWMKDINLEEILGSHS
ncbi:mastermind-like protein 2 [Chanos chanos]|uniref:Mastermind-like protein 2 n=1 Tax=Chanos chanos TaxID=29144 RepID=A0A6J2VQ05_CHACN|nr:mastermind-like protein 2 [Chanos chanos]